jgi:hypothetical protein
LYAREIDETYQIHFNSFVNRDFHINWKSRNFYELFAALSCPLVNELAKAIVQ